MWCSHNHDCGCLLPYLLRSRPPLPRLAVTIDAGVLAITGTALAPTAQATGEAAGTVTVVARNLDNPRGLAFGPHGDLYIAEAGHGGALSLGNGPEGPQYAGLTSGMSKLEDGKPTKAVDHLISVASPKGTGCGGLVADPSQGNRN